MKETISLVKDRIKLKGNGKIIIIPIDSLEGKPWEKLDGINADVRWTYEVFHGNEDIDKLNNIGELHLGSSMSIR